MLRRHLIASLVMLPLSFAVPAFVPSASAADTVEVLLPPWGTLPKAMTDRLAAETGTALDTQTLGWDQILTKIATSMIAGSPPADATEVDWSWVGQFGAANWYQPLEGVVDAATIADIPSAKLFVFNGQLLAVPYANDFRVLIYNRDHLKRAGIAAAPTTPEQLLADAKAIKAKHISQYPIALPLSASEGSATAWYLLTKVFGGELFNDQFEPQFVKPDSAGYKAMAFEVDALKSGLISPAATGLKDVEVQELFKKGEASFDLAGWAGNVAVYSDPAKSKVADQVAAALMLTTTGTARTIGLPEAVGIPASAKNKGGAKAFINWFVKPQNQIDSYQTLGNLPTRTSVLKQLNSEGKLKSGDVILQQATLVDPLFKQGTPVWYPQFTSAVSSALNQAAKGELTVAQAVAQIAEQAQSAMQP
ncbi:extracellular solute-binding protein [Pseudomonas typographi]|uniref:Extracellular solute-binding protein n=1 Tax=Pseudomonas typographi TaxID=2715964 RepID=A0ABR7Z112_9PSED|nr:extracellular solute-binding protein [Pseudomonas typographi]MBD1552227.1 extracellular solute-binding protein [Pseudomonas typographi]MBD1587349.1 extracellular solute-binding protein [Pseudomonas typographi]MBD1599155.1 extracellular solute-binding protein [Pseudomonas typographi]